MKPTRPELRVDARRRMERVPTRRGDDKGGLEPRLRDDISGAVLDPDRPLVWRRLVPRAPEFELRQDETVFGEMEPALASGTDAEGECLGRALELRLDAGLFRGIRVTSRRSAGRENGPSFRGFLFGWGRLETGAGEVLRWRHGFRGLYDHVLLDADGRELLRLRPAFLRFVHTETSVVVSPAGWDRPDLSDLLLLTWFLRVHAEGWGRRVFGRSGKHPGNAAPPASPTLP